MPFVLFWLLAVAAGYHLTRGFGSAGSLEAFASLGGPGAATQSSALLVFTLSLRKLLIFGLGALLIWAAAFYPGRRYHPTVVVLKYAAGFAALGLAGLVIYQKAATAGAGARLLSDQAAGPFGLLLTASQAPHSTLELLALAPVLVAPVYMLIRAVQVRSLGRASFETWVEVRQRLLLWAPLLVAAACVEVYVTPVVMGFTFH